MTDLIIIGVLTFSCVVTVVLITAIYHKVSRMRDDINRMANDIGFIAEVVDTNVLGEPD